MNYVLCFSPRKFQFQFSSCKSPAKKWKFSSLRSPRGYHVLFDLKEKKDKIQIESFNLLWWLVWPCIEVPYLLHLFKIQARPLYILGSGGKPMPFIRRRCLTLLRPLLLSSSMVVMTRTILAGSISFMLIEAGRDWPHSILHQRRISATTRID